MQQEPVTDQPSQFSDNIIEKIEKDPIWIIRAASTPAWRRETLDKAQQNQKQRVRAAAEALGAVDSKKVRRALEKILLRTDPQPALQWLSDCGALQAVLPELEATVHFSQEAGRRHKDVWAHTKQVVAQAPQRPAVRWAALLHDIGKVHTRTYTADGRVQFLGHPEKGAALFRRISRRFGFPRALGRKIHFLILKHLRANQYTGDWSDSAVRRFYRQAGEHLQDLLDLSRADITTKRPRRKQQAYTYLDELSRRIETLQAQDAEVPPLPAGLGNHLMDHFAFPPGPLIGKLRNLLETAVQRGVLEPDREPDHYIQYLEQNRDLWQN
jgi:poly(A) polymerase